MRSLYAASALAMAAGPALQAQTTGSTPATPGGTTTEQMGAGSTTAPAPSGPYTMTGDQQGNDTGWPADRRSAYDALPAAQQEYFWTLTPGQQAAWWLLRRAGIL